ncbi:NUDIX domain-containing protein [Candidatus Woesearchaeota archaeon]|nr:NUDIX domain-containing protein [Candidatus Woesearchaeota archaeon]
MKTQEAAAGIITDKNKKEFLLLKKKGAWTGWQFPQGKIDKGETPEQAIRREIEEETGIKDIIDIKRLPYKHDYWFMEKDEKIHKFLTFFIMSAEKTDNITVSKEHSDFKWCGYEEALKDLKYNKEIFEEAVKNHLR